MEPPKQSAHKAIYSKHQEEGILVKVTQPVQFPEPMPGRQGEVGGLGGESADPCQGSSGLTKTLSYQIFSGFSSLPAFFQR